MTLGELVAQARETLLAGGVPRNEAAGDAEFLARHALGWDLTTFALARGERPPVEFHERFAALIARRVKREPVSQIVGYREFWGLEFEVSRDVLTPRPETELVVEAALEAFPRDAPIVIMDVGTGSGCLAVALATEFPAAMLIASDISLPALAVARRNATRHRVQHRIAFLHSGDLAPEHDVDLIVSNPPYVAMRDAALLAVEVREYEPHVALFGGPDGLDVYRGLLRATRQALAVGDDGRLILEVGYGQAGPVSDLARAQGWDRERVHRDLQGIDRVLTFQPAPQRNTA